MKTFDFQIVETTSLKKEGARHPPGGLIVYSTLLYSITFAFRNDICMYNICKFVIAKPTMSYVRDTEIDSLNRHRQSELFNKLGYTRKKERKKEREGGYKMYGNRHKARTKQ